MTDVGGDIGMNNNITLFSSSSHFFFTIPSFQSSRCFLLFARCPLFAFPFCSLLFSGDLIRPPIHPIHSHGLARVR